ncbi:MAG TPA: ankyrin repeat domain-containing protein [Sedimentisphaerales bacterium]|nr:ankyrin repeat domain-containing protein [Sedimentisphaerales bacterium]
MKNRSVFVFVMMAVLGIIRGPEAVWGEIHLYVDARRGGDEGVGSPASPLKSLYAATRQLPKQINEDVTIHIGPGNYETTGGKGLDGKRLELNGHMAEGVSVRIVGNDAAFEKPAPIGSVVLNWENRSSRFMIVAGEGQWALENIQLGTRKDGQRGGIGVTGPAVLELRDVRIHTVGQKGPGLGAHHGGRIYLYGDIELNQDLHNSGGDDGSFCRIEAEYGGVVKFMQGKGATLTLGNGNISASYYGVIELGCEQASITSWNYQSNPIAVNNSGRVDLHNTTTTLCARNPRNTPIGLEHDAHLLAEGARIIIDGQGNSNGIVLQKASSFFCNDVEIRGKVRQPLVAMSGSVLLAGIDGDLGETFATTCASIIVEKCTGHLIGPFKQSKSGRIVPPEGKTIGAVSEPNDKTVGGFGAAVSGELADAASLPELHRAAYGGHAATVRQLITQGADVRAKGPKGRTALHIAAMAGHRMVCEILLGEGAEIQACDNQGHTPAQLAEMQGHNGLADFLRKWQSETK